MNVFAAGVKLAKESEKEGYNANDDITQMLDRPIEEIQKVLDYKNNTLSLDVQIFDDSEGTLGDLVSCEAYNPEGQNMDDEGITMLEAFLSSLPELERLVLAKRYGLQGHAIKTLREVGAELDMTRERVRQTQPEHWNIL